ncbi:hypothetical protein HY498_04545 [Candidatus Woesearchaeota archaeon]|nr:hypothetical protein [Candidatus Woesearchaeota archaeon]
MNKKGVSPLIATVLLVTLVVILITLLLVWLRGFVEERISKENALAEAELKCTNINLDIKRVLAFEDRTKLIFEATNTGSEDIAGLVLRFEVSGISPKIKTIEQKIRPFETFSTTFDDVETAYLLPTTRVTIIPNVKPAGIGAPLVPCSGEKVRSVVLI